MQHAPYVFYSSRVSIVARALLLDDLVAIGVNDTKPNWLKTDTFIRAEVPRGVVDISAGPAAHLLVSKKQWRCVPDDVGYFGGWGSFSGQDPINELDESTG
ncbi:hypothetical protein GCM10011352_14040 [Marinobacterium zhoushanense]|uniref:Uncharacterized protein n=1 Tax=Marinobacterium zhoushanense TaxID=1679163 RepID=A0ABQ1K5X0_9GAMM|nr:hypothetical protein GCM10011352_14040 [Marinobacterium zhoushanense]